MAATGYTLTLLKISDCQIVFSAAGLQKLLKIWRNGQHTSDTCITCKQPINFLIHFATCCNLFYYKPTTCYPIKAIIVVTPGYSFLLHDLKERIIKNGIVTNQEYIVIPDFMYLQVKTTITLEGLLKFVQGLPLTKKSKVVQPPSKALEFYDKIQNAPLNHGSLHRRSGGKNTNYRQWSFGKRVRRSCRAMIVPAPHLKPNEIVVPKSIQKHFNVLGKYVLINRMPSLQPENMTALRVVETWDNKCVGLPLEVMKQMDADCDGDEINALILDDLQSQAECAMLMDTRHNMGSFNMGIKLTPSQDMLVAYHLFYDEIDFLPYKDPESLTKTFRVIYDLFGSEVTFECFDRMREFYLDVLENRVVFGITLEEIEFLVESAHDVDYETFCAKVRDSKGCLVTQVRAEAKGSFYHLYQMFGSLGNQGNFNVKTSLWEGLSAADAVAHAVAAYDAMIKYNQIWEPGYTHTKCMYNLQGITVDNMDRLIDGKMVVANDILDVMDPLDAISKDGFKELVKTVLCCEKKRKLDDNSECRKKHKLEDNG